MDKNPVPFILLDSTVLTNGLRVLADGVDTSHFERNPVMFYYHQDYDLPIGRWENIRKESGKLLADAVFDYDDDDKLVQRIIGKVKRNMLRMASVSLADFELSYDEAYTIEKQDGPTVMKCRLREASIVPIGKNFSALRLFDKEGQEINYQQNPMQLADFISKTKIKTTMKKETLEILNLADNAPQEAVEAAVLKLHDEKEKANKKVLELSDDNKKLQEKLDAIELADKQEKKAAFEDNLAIALKDGRLSESTEKPGSVKQSWLDLYDKSPEGAATALQNLVPHQSASKIELSDKGESAWNKRQKEIEQNAKK